MTRALAGVLALAACHSTAVTPVRTSSPAFIYDHDSASNDFDQDLPLSSRLERATALLAAGHPHACRRMLAPVVTPYAHEAEASDEEVQELMDRSVALDERCMQALERSLADFTTPACSSTASCFSLDADPDDPPQSACPLVHHAAAALIADAGPLVDEDFCCGVDDLTTASRGGTRYVRVSSSHGPVRVCSGGTAARSLDAIYEVRRDKLVLVADYSLGLH